jgi:hypothetical protein
MQVDTDAGVVAGSTEILCMAVYFALKHVQNFDLEIFLSTNFSGCGRSEPLYPGAVSPRIAGGGPGTSSRGRLRPEVCPYSQRFGELADAPDAIGQLPGDAYGRGAKRGYKSAEA